MVKCQTTELSVIGKKMCDLAHALIVPSHDLEISILAYLKQDQKSTLPKQVGSNTLISCLFLALKYHTVRRYIQRRQLEVSVFPLNCQMLIVHSWYSRNIVEMSAWEQ